jgi:hypothetical protein
MRQYLTFVRVYATLLVQGRSHDPDGLPRPLVIPSSSVTGVACCFSTLRSSFFGQCDKIGSEAVNLIAYRFGSL